MLVRNIPVKSGDILLTPGDIHFGEEDPDALDLMLEVAVAQRVNTICLIGDTFESAGISRHASLRRRAGLSRGTILREKGSATPYVQGLLEIVRSYRKDPGGLHVLTGNHEDWWRELSDEYPGLSETPWYELYGDLFDHWHIHAEYTALRFGPLLVCHGHRLRGSLSARSASTVLGNYPGQNTLYGHTHRVDSCITPSYKYGRPIEHGAWTCGHLRRIEGEMIDPFLGPLAERHKQGFALTYFYEVEGEVRFKVELITIDRKPSGAPFCIVGGILYG